MAAPAPPKRPRVTVENINVPGSTSQVDGIKYEAARRALLKALPARKPGLTQAEMLQAVPAHLPEEEFPGGAKAGWWIKCVQLDLEAKGVIERDRTAKPLRWHRLK
ncbi:hypothetical protein [uncultured Methylibium sp.]|uniref:DUF6958 family protein n=1 Tax=uncultured Methylibium sp. TaxID=381093 RepID=UPI0025CEF0EB|nr:hypothetical protein [uncultured Methylibium sp.]